MLFLLGATVPKNTKTKLATNTALTLAHEYVRKFSNDVPTDDWLALAHGDDDAPAVMICFLLCFTDIALTVMHSPKHTTISQ